MDINKSECIQSAQSIGYTTYVDICGHTTTTVSWGSLDWALAGIIGLAALCLLGVILAVVYMFVTEFA